MQARQVDLSLRPGLLRTSGTVLALVLLIAVSACSKKVPIVEFKRPPVTASVPAAPSAPSEPDSGGEEVETADNLPPVSVSEPEASPPPPPRPARPSREETPADEPAPPAEPSLDERLPELDPDTREKLVRADSLLVLVDARPLSSIQRQQAGSARAFVAQAKKAIREGDERRAVVLLGKGLLLVEDLERSSR